MKSVLIYQLYVAASCKPKWRCSTKEHRDYSPEKAKVHFVIGDRSEAQHHVQAVSQLHHRPSIIFAGLPDAKIHSLLPFTGYSGSNEGDG